MPLMTFQAAETFSVAGMALVALHPGMGGRSPFHLGTGFRMTADTDGTQIFY